MNRKRYFLALANKEKNPVGQLSPELRRALSLEDDMLPFWIYRMRILGYPPAWMKDAEMSTLSMVDVAGPSRNNPLADEEGEIKDTKAQYNKDSLIEFPGFNAPIPDNVKDDWLILGMPPLIMNQQLSEAVKSMKLIEPVPYKKTKLDLSIDSKDDSQIISPASPDPNDNNADNDVILIEESKAIPEGNGAQSSSSANGHASHEASNGKASTSTRPSLNSDDIANGETGSSSSKEPKQPMISMGAPVPHSIGPNLPPLENWAVGMGELMHFENLPTSTGAYKGKMKGILDKIRSRHNESESDM